jgi:hypothetical protein
MFQLCFNVSPFPGQIDEDSRIRIARPNERAERKSGTRHAGPQVDARVAQQSGAETGYQTRRFFMFAQNHFDAQAQICCPAIENDALGRLCAGLKGNRPLP